MQNNGESATTRTSLELLYNISRELTEALDLGKVLHRVMTLSMGNVGAVNGSIIVLDSSGEPIEGIIYVGDKVIEDATQQLSGTLHEGLAGWVIHNKKGALIANTRKDERWLRRPDDDEQQTGAKSAVCVPLIVHQQLVGAMTLVHPSPGFFSQAHLDLLSSLSAAKKGMVVKKVTQIVIRIILIFIFDFSSIEI